MNDKKFLQWLHDRLLNVHHENEWYDYMHKLRAIIHKTPENQNSSNTPRRDITIEKLELVTVFERKELVVCFSNNIYHAVLLSRPYGAEQLVQALEQLQYQIARDPLLKKDVRSA